MTDGDRIEWGVLTAVIEVVAFETTSRFQAIGAIAATHKPNTILLIVLVLILIAAIPTLPYSRGWGYAPSGVLGLVLVVVLVLLLLGKLWRPVEARRRSIIQLESRQ